MTSALRLPVAPWALAPGTRCLCLGRVSTKHQAGPDKTSLAHQAEATRAFAAALAPEHGFGPEHVELRDDPGVSGLDPDRLEEIVAACERAPRPSRAPGFVVVFDMSRFTRLGTQSAMYYLERLKRAGWQLRDTTLKLSDAPGMEMANAVAITVACEVAAELSRMISRKAPPGMRDAANDGRWCGGSQPPLGYVVGPDKRLVPGDEADKVRRAFAAYVKGATLEAVGEIVGLGQSGARALLGNPAYIGTMVWGRRKGSEHHGRKEGAHKAIIDRRTWDAAQDRLQSRGAKFAHGATRPAPLGALPYVLSGLVRCTCRDGQAFVGGGGVPADATEEERLRWRGYQCKACRARVGQAALEATVVEAVADFIRDADESGDLKRRLDRWVTRRLAASSGKDVAHERAELLKSEARLIKLAETTDNANVAKRLDEVTAALRALDEAQGARPDPKAVRAEAADILRQTRAFATGTKDLSPEAVNTSLHNLQRLFANITFDRATRTVEVSFTLWHHETKVGVVPTTSRVSHSGYNAPWRVRA